jgi:hypothetical protein
LIVLRVPVLIRRFIDPDAEFIYVSAGQVLPEAKAQGAIPYDIPDVEFTHEGERCSFDTFLRLYDIVDPPLDRLALIVRGADTSRHDLAPQCSGVFAISLGLSANFADDHEMLDSGMVIYDANMVSQSSGGNPQLAATLEQQNYRGDYGNAYHSLTCCPRRHGCARR